ncbi:lipoxygenase [Xylariaceae sp. FL1651]|nr:lipoxygenase [Xylariaceae sp. FL1651]
MKSTIIGAVLAAAVHALPALTERDYGTTKATLYSIPNFDPNTQSRADALAVKQKGWLYGSEALGVAPYPVGTLANKTLTEQQNQWYSTLLNISKMISEDTQAALKALNAEGEFKSLDDYGRLYDNLWQQTVPDGLFPGMLSNYTDDRLFSMMRLSASPYRIRRVQRSDALLFPVDNAASITGLSQKQLQSQGRLFSVDYSDLKDLPPAEQWGAGCQAYFYIHPKSGDFLPLAIKPILKGMEEKALVYTPEDKPTDWMLAKLMFNQNDNWHVTFAHITQSHSAAEAPYLAAIRAFSDDHPILAIMNRFEKTPWGIRPLLETTVVESGVGNHYYPWTGYAARQYTNQVYSSGEVSNFQSNYYRTNLENRGLINSRFGPALKHFPFYEDTSVVVGIMRDFMEDFIYSYYPNDRAVLEDKELQNWAREGQIAKVRDFPTSIPNRETVVDMLTHMAYLGSVVHSVMSSNGAIGDSASLPFAPSAFWKPLPTEKGVTDIMQYMPPIDGAVWQVSTLAGANRAIWRNTNETMSHMFDDDTMLSRMNGGTKAAAAKFKAAMYHFSDVVRARKFDKDGLSQGLPFMWNVLDPNWAPYWSVV